MVYSFAAGWPNSFTALNSYAVLFFSVFRLLNNHKGKQESKPFNSQQKLVDKRF